MILESDRKVFNAICLFSSFVYLREKYERLEFTEEEDKSNIKKLESKMATLTQYEHLPDIHNRIEEQYYKLKEFIKNDTFLRVELFEYVSSFIFDIAEDEKHYILNSVVDIAKLDNKISEQERPMIVQISESLGLGRNYSQIMKNYHASTFVSNDKKIISILVAALIIIITLGSYLYYDQSTKKINFFDKQKIVFSEMSFNRYIIYRNKYNVEDEHFRKQAIFFLDGIAEVSIDSKFLHYDKETRKLVVAVPSKKYIFDIDTSFKQAVLFDKLNPEPISKSDAQKISGIIGIVGLGVGAKGGYSVGKALKSILPPQFKPFAKVAGSVGGAALVGAGTYFVALNTLDGLKLSSDITKDEELEVLDNGKILIEKSLLVNSDLQKEYKERFEKFIKLKFGSYGYKVNNFEYILEDQ